LFRHHSTRPYIALLTTLLIALALPVAAIARPPYDGPGYRLPAPPASAEPSTPVGSGVPAVVKEDARDALPIALAGAALLVAIAGTGYTMMRNPPVRDGLRGQH
jgi:hypothetical protein